MHDETLPQEVSWGRRCPVRSGWCRWPLWSRPPA
jgi:hypothetical protein